MNSVNNKSETYYLSDLWLRVGDWKPEGEFTVLYHVDTGYYLPEPPRVLNVTKEKHGAEKFLILYLKSEVNRTITSLTYNILDARTGTPISIPNVRLINETYSEGRPGIPPLGFYEIRFFFRLSEGAVNGEYPALIVVNSTNHRVTKPIIIAIRAGSATTDTQPKTPTTVFTTTVYITTTVTRYLTNTSEVKSAVADARTVTQSGADSITDTLRSSSIGIGIALAGVALALAVYSRQVR